MESGLFFKKPTVSKDQDIQSAHRDTTPSMDIKEIKIEPVKSNKQLNKPKSTIGDFDEKEPGIQKWRTLINTDHRGGVI